MNKIRVRIILLIESMLFISAALMHFGILISGYDHAEAGRAETVIERVLLGGLGISLIRPAWTRIAGLAVQIFALLGTFVGISMIAIAVGPRTLPDIVYHVCMVSALVIGLIITARSKKVIQSGSESLAR